VVVVAVVVVELLHLRLVVVVVAVLVLLAGKVILLHLQLVVSRAPLRREMMAPTKMVNGAAANGYAHTGTNVCTVG
jgi:hypothetical protein